MIFKILIGPNKNTNMIISGECQTIINPKPTRLYFSSNFQCRITMQQTCSLDISSSSEFPRRNTKLRIQYSVESSIFLYPNCSLAYPFFFFLFLPWFLWVLVILNYSLLGSSLKYTTKDGGLVCNIVNEYYCQKHRIWFWWRILFFKQLDYACRR